MAKPPALRTPSTSSKNRMSGDRSASTGTSGKGIPAQAEGRGGTSALFPRRGAVPRAVNLRLGRRITAPLEGRLHCCAGSQETNPALAPLQVEDVDDRDRHSRDTSPTLREGLTWATSSCGDSAAASESGSEETSPRSLPKKRAVEVVPGGTRTRKSRVDEGGRNEGKRRLDRRPSAGTDPRKREASHDPRTENEEDLIPDRRNAPVCLRDVFRQPSR